MRHTRVYTEGYDCGYESYFATCGLHDNPYPQVGHAIKALAYRHGWWDARTDECNGLSADEFHQSRTDRNRIKVNTSGEWVAI